MAKRRQRASDAFTGRAPRPEALTPEALLNRGLALKSAGRLDDAMASYDRALALRPDYANALLNRGNLLHQMGRTVEAVASYDRAIALCPQDADAFYNRGGALEALGRFADARISYETATALKPGFAQAFDRLGNALRELGRLDEALGACNRAVALLRAQQDASADKRRQLAQSLHHRGNSRRALARFDAALADYREALALDPSLAETRLNIGLTLLLLGDWENGWDGYEARWHKRQGAAPRPEHKAPIWNGEAPAGKRILLWGEQGQGDIIQFIRFVPALLARGARVTLAAPQRLHRLLEGAAPGMTLTEQVSPQETFDFQLALLSLPRVLGLRPQMPAMQPYLQADPERAALWRARLGPHGLKIGLCWQGNPAASIDAGRSIPLARFAPLAAIAGVRLISLQKMHGLEQIARRPAAMTLELPAHEVDGGRDAFIDTAAMMMNLDLIETSDTAIAHLAGALGRPVWVALKNVPDWRWLLARPDSVWYPSMRLFRQSRAGDWSTPLGEIAAAIAGLARQTGAGGVSECA